MYERDSYHFKATHTSRTESVDSILVSEKSLKRKVAGKTRIRLKVRIDGEILPFWQKATKRQAKDTSYCHNCHKSYVALSRWKTLQSIRLLRP